MEIDVERRAGARARWILAGLAVLGLTASVALHVAMFGPSTRGSAPPELVRPEKAEVRQTQTRARRSHERPEATQTEHQYASPLHAAIATDDHRLFVESVSRLEYLQAVDLEGNTALHLAVRRQALSYAAALLLAGANPVAQNHSGKTPAFVLQVDGATAYSRVERFRRLLRTPVDEQPEEARLAQARFFVAADKADAELLEQAIAQGADIDRQMTPDGRVALHYAKSVEAIDLLARVGSDLDSQDENGDTPLMAAVSERSQRRVKALINAGADVNIRNRASRSALTIAVAASRNADTGSVSHLLRSGSRVELEDWRAAMQARNPDTLQELFDHGAMFSVHSSEGQEILRVAQMHGGQLIDDVLRAQPGIGSYLRDQDQANEQDRQRDLETLAKAISPHLVVFFVFVTLLPLGFALLVRFITARLWAHWLATVALSVLAVYLAFFPRDLQRGIAEFRFFGEPLDWATPVLALVAVAIAAVAGAITAPIAFMAIRPTGARPRWPVRSAAVLILCLTFGLLVLHHQDRIGLLDRSYRALVEPGGPEPDTSTATAPAPRKSASRSVDTNDLWFDSITNDQHDPVSDALAAGADPDRRDPLGQTALHLAASKRHMDLVVILLQNGADTELRDRYGNTALHIPLHDGGVSPKGSKVMALLLAAGADANAPGFDERLPLCRIVAKDRFGRNNERIITIAGQLLKYGASPRHPHCAPLHVAKSPETIQLLLDHGANLEDPAPFKVNSRSSYGQVTPLWRAAHDSDHVRVRMFRDLGADIDARDSSLGFTPLQVALANLRYRDQPTVAQRTVVDLLRTGGADVDALTYDGTSTPQLDRHGLVVGQ